ncbi:ZPR1 zinc-finger domain protein [Perilla frutescens var. frutescens]|nr:ZPR1 zinc-finger domain protein [Perilla frutescens var. frutescens]
MFNLPLKSNLKAATTCWMFHQVIKRLYSVELDVMFNRQVVKSETATIKIPELDFEIPPEAQRGSLSTVEGILLRAADELDALQEERKVKSEAIDEFLIKLRACASGESYFTFILDDPAGNSFIENPCAPSPDPSLTIKFYERTPEQQATLGYLADPSQGEPGIENNLDGTNNDSQTQEEPHGSVGARAGRRAIAQGNNSEIADALFRYSAPKEVMTFPTTCSGCGTKCDCRMFVTSILVQGCLNSLILIALAVLPVLKVSSNASSLIDLYLNQLSQTDIPYFQEVIVMASTCDGCGYRNSEVKAGGAIPDKGEKIIVHVKNVRDLSHDVIKSDTAAVKIPELELELSSGTLGGLVTTVEGLISKIGEKPWTLILDDALANSFVAPISDEIKDDIQLSFEEYERSWEQNEELGLNDMDTSSADVAYLSADVEPNEKTDA